MKKIYLHFLRWLCRKHILKHTSEVILDTLGHTYMTNPDAAKIAVADVRADLFEGLIKNGYIALEEFDGGRHKIFRASIRTFTP